jgi:hypothetical protein
MNDQQRFALEHHCRFAFETARQCFASLDRSCRASVVLTVNSGWE